MKLFLAHKSLTYHASLQLIWFLTPTVALCLQQFKFISDNIPAVRARTLTSLDKVELWTEQPIWDAILKEMQVVVSTHAVLASAMSHGFVKITQLGLLIFDEGIVTRCFKTGGYMM